MKSTFFGLLLIILSANLIAQQQSERFYSDKNYKKYISPLTGYKYNAISVSISEPFISKTLDIHYQRRITPRIWGEAGLSFGLGRMSSEFVKSYIGYFSLTRETANLDLKFADPDLFMDFDPNFNIQMGGGYKLGIYRSILGIAPYNTISYGLQFHHRTMTLEYGVNSKSQNKFLDNTSKLKSNSVLLNFMYKSNVAGPVGFDICLGLGPAFLNLSDSKPYTPTKLNKVAMDYAVQVRLFFAFLKF